MIFSKNKEMNNFISCLDTTLRGGAKSDRPEVTESEIASEEDNSSMTVVVEQDEVRAGSEYRGVIVPVAGVTFTQDTKPNHYEDNKPGPGKKMTQLKCFTYFTC